MKYEVFASQLEAQVWQSPVRGGEVIKTDRKEMKNLPISADAQKSIKAFFYDFSCQREQRSSLLGPMPSAAENGCRHFSKYMEENYNAVPEQLMLDWNCVGANARFIAKGLNIQYRLWERSEGHMGIPDMTAIVYEFAFSYISDKAKYDPGQILGDLVGVAFYVYNGTELMYKRPKNRKFRKSARLSITI